jgi:hypothetical protein
MAVGRREVQGAKEQADNGTTRRGNGSVARDEKASGQWIMLSDQNDSCKKNGERESKLASRQEKVGATADKPKPPHRWRGNGANRLMKAADEAVGLNAEVLVDLLLMDAQHGRAASARLLVALSEKMEEARKKKLESKDRSKMRHGGLTAADLLGSEEDWESETDEALEGERSMNTDQWSENHGQGDAEQKSVMPQMAE